MKKTLLITLSLIGITLISAAPVGAASPFEAGRIIDDSVFTEKSSMSPSQIQTFLNSKVLTCDTWGTQPSEFGGGTRRQWGEARGFYPPYTCLKDYSENGKSAAQIIYDTAQEFAINPQVFIVLLQKEQGLVTDTWPTSTQYKTATGYGCPDTAPCDSQYFGLTNQLRWSGRMFRAILNNSPTWYTPYVLGSNYIQYSPTASCGGSNVNIQNRSTQALYNYTPYQPNQAALDAGWGTASCGAYGNRNFYLYFTSWFGDTRGGQPPISDSIKVINSLSVTPNGSNSENQAYTVSFTLKNNSGSKIDVGWMLVSIRDSGNFNLDLPAKYVSIAPYGTYTYSAARTFQWTDNMHAYINGNLTQGIGWSTTQPSAANDTVSKVLDFRVGSDVVLTGGGIRVERIGQTSTYKATAILYNRTNQDKNIGWYLVSGRNPFGENIDFPAQNIDVPAKGYVTYTQTRDLTLSDLGQYTFFSNLNDTNPGGLGWTTDYPMRNDIWTKKSHTFTLGPAVIQSKSLEVDVNQDGEATATVTFKNQGSQSEYLGWVIVSTRRNGDSTNYDFQPQELTLKPGETRTLTFKQSVLRSGSYTSQLLFNRPSGWTSTYAPITRTTIDKQATFTGIQSAEQLDNLSLISSGQNRTASVVLKNRSNKQQDLGWVILSVRDAQGRNYDFPGVSVKLAANETKTFSSSRSIPQGSYIISVTANHPRFGWGTTFDTSGTNYPISTSLH